jgi:plasmid stabilization system protein ParE
VIAQAQAVMDAEEARAQIALRDPDYAERWITELDGVFEKLAEFPNRHPLAPESPRVAFAVRQILVGRYRVLFAVRGDSVHIMRIRHSAKRPFKPEELG